MTRHTFILILLLFTLLSSLFTIRPASAFPVAPVPQTGQTTCYDASGTMMDIPILIDCAGTGQDGESQAGLVLPTPRFADNGDATLTDNLTGLIWSKDEPATTGMSWQAALDYIKTLNNSNYLGHNDWRLPNINELKSLVNPGQSYPAGSLRTEGFTGFSGHNQNYYWSSTTFASIPEYKWFVSFDDGSVVKYRYYEVGYVHPVRGGQSGSFGYFTVLKTGQTSCFDESGVSIPCSGTGQDGEFQTGATWPATRFVAGSDQTVTDTSTGLIWTNKYVSGGATTLNSKGYLGYNDWRPPNINELTSLINYGQSDNATWLNSQGFTGLNNYDYYYSSTRGLNPSSSWVLNFSYGFFRNVSNGNNINFSGFVRGGQYRSFGDLIISTPSQFATLPVGTTQTARQIEIGNRGTTSLSITSIALTGTNASEFTIASGGSNPCGSTAPTLVAGVSCTMMLGFTPLNTNGVKRASLEIRASGITNNIPVSGGTIANYTLNFNSGVNGTITGTTNQTINHASNATAVTAVPSANYHLVNWTGTGGFVTTTANPLTVANVTAAQTITANFAINTFALNFTSGGVGTITGTTNQSVTYATNATAVTAVPSANYHFVNWTGTGGFVTSTANPLTVTNVTSAKTITANFAINTFAVNFASGGNGTISGTANQIVNYGASSTAVTAVPSANYHFVNWTGTGGFVTTTANPLTVTNVTSAKSITANFAIDTFAVNFASGGNGAITGTTSQTINYGNNASAVSALPATGYHFVFWAGSGGFVTSSSNPLTVTNVTAAQTIIANFMIDTFAINFASGENGTVTGTANQTINYNASTTSVTAVPSTGYHFVNWTGTSGFVTSTTNPLIVANVKTSQTITANFAIDTFAVNFASSGNGTLTGTTSQTINYNTSATAITAVPATGYHFVNWAGTNGFVTTTANPLTVPYITTAMTITANFLADSTTPINGVCGTSSGKAQISIPTTNICTKGTSTAITGIGPWYWSCNGINGGAAASCTANKQVVTGTPSLTWRHKGDGKNYAMTTDGTNVTGGEMFYQESDTAWAIVGQGDFDGDGIRDLVWWNSTTGQVYIMLMASTTATKAGGAVIYTEPNVNWRIVATGDIDGDGRTDLLWWNKLTGDVYAMLINGASTTGGGIIYTEANTSWKIVAFADFNGNGKPELLWWNSSTGQVAIGETNGTATSTAAIIYTEPNTDWRIAGAGDLDGDGKADIVWHNKITGQVYGMQTNGSSVSGGNLMYTEPNTYWEIISIGNYNGDNKADLLWWNSSTGQVYVMPMNGLTPLTGSLLYSEPDTTWRIQGETEWRDNLYGKGVTTTTK